MKNAICALLMACVGLAIADTSVSITSVTAQQRYPWNGKVDIVVTIRGDTNAIALTECVFVATNCATQAAMPVTAISQVGAESFSGDVCMRRYLWDSMNDVGAVEIDDLELTVDIQKKLGGVQLWENGPFWAECNVGASKPEEYGYYFWWGDTVGYKINWSNNGCWSWVSVKDGSYFKFDGSNCTTCSKDNSILQSLGYIDSTGNLVAAHDAANVHLGAPWRMPTEAEMGALTNNCDSTWTTRNGVHGRLVTGREAFASKSIFLPAAGYARGSGIYSRYSFGYYWSSTPCSDCSEDAWYLNVSSGNFRRFDNYRSDGRSVRPLREFSNLVSRAGLGVGKTVRLQLDNRSEIRECSLGGETFYRNVAWYENAESISIYDNGVEIGSRIDGKLQWQPTVDGLHFLELTAYSSNGDKVGMETVGFFLKTCKSYVITSPTKTMAEMFGEMRTNVEGS